MAEAKSLKLSNEKTVIVGFIPAMSVPKAAKQLLVVGGPVIGEVLKLFADKATPGADMKKALEDGKLAGLIRQAMATDDVLLTEVMMTLASASSVIGLEGSLKKNFDACFTGSPKSIVEWFVEAVKVNFSDFFSDSESPTG